MRDFAELVVAERETLNGLTFDAQSSSNYKSYISSYEIPETEQVLLYAGTRDRFDGTLTGSGTFITDEAIYLHPSRKKYTQISRIPLSSICEYLVYETGDKNVNLLGAAKEYQIFAYSRDQLSGTAASLVALLHKLQKSMMVKPADKSAYIKTLKHTCLLIRTRFRETGVLDDNFKSILEVMETIPEFRREAVFFELEDMYRRGSSAAYDVLLDAKAALLNEDNIRVLRNPDELFANAYIADLLDREGFSDVKATIDAYLFLKEKKEFSLKQVQILMALCVRMEDYEYFDELIKLVGSELPSDDLWHLFSFYTRFKNEKMGQIQVKIARKEPVVSASYLYTSDLGFSSLHYALLFRNKDLIRDLLPACDWSKYKSPLPREKMCDVMYEPLFVATMIYDDLDLLCDIFKYTSPKAGALNRSISGLCSIIDINISLREKYPHLAKSYTEKLQEYRALLSDMEKELRQMVIAEVDRYRKLAVIIKETAHPLCNYLFRLYGNREEFIKSIKEPQRYFRLNKYGQLFFISAGEQETSLSYIKWEDNKVSYVEIKDADRGYFGPIRDRAGSFYENPVYKRAQEEKRRLENEKAKRAREFHARIKDPMPYDRSWFSKAAHQDIKALKEEYRTLVKKYHPDSSGDHRTAEVLMRIMAERADILEAIKNNSISPNP